MSGAVNLLLEINNIKDALAAYAWIHRSADSGQGVAIGRPAEIIAIVGVGPGFELRLVGQGANSYTEHARSIRLAGCD